MIARLSPDQGNILNPGRTKKRMNMVGRHLRSSHYSWNSGQGKDWEGRWSWAHEAEQEGAETLKPQQREVGEWQVMLKEREGKDLGRCLTLRNVGNAESQWSSRPVEMKREGGRRLGRAEQGTAQCCLGSIKNKYWTMTTDLSEWDISEDTSIDYNRLIKKKASGCWERWLSG